MIRAFFAFFLCALTSCSSTSTQGELLLMHGSYFGIPFEIAVPKTMSRKEQNKVNAIVKQVFKEIDAHCNHWNPDSEITGMHHKGTYLVSPLIEELFSVSLAVHKATNGLFDPGAVGNSKVWKKTKQFTRSVTSPFSEISARKREVTLPHSMYFDFDGIVKGFAVDEITKRLRSNGFSQFLVNWSGEIYASGRHPAGRKWIVFLPHAKKGIELENEALATSGSTFNIWDDGTNVCTHILNPKENTLTDPRARPEAISVKARSCAEADAYATALYIDPTLPVKQDISLIK